MNKFKYLELLSSKLEGAVPADDYNDIMQYYTEYFSEAGPEKEQEVIEELGNPEDLAAKIIAGVLGKQSGDVAKKSKSGLSTGWIVFIAIIGSPIWLTLLIGAFALLITLFAILFSIGAVSAAFVFGSVFLFIGGIVQLFASPLSGMMLMGLGLMMAAVSLGALMLFVLLFTSVKKLCKRIKMRRKFKGVIE